MMKKKKFLDKNLEIYTIFEKTMEGHTAWDPMNPDTIRTDLNPKEIVNIFDKKHSLKISIYLVKKLLKHKWYKTRKTAKKKSMWATEFRNEQFENIKDKLKQAVEDWAGVFSMDVKKRKLRIISQRWKDIFNGRGCSKWPWLRKFFNLKSNTSLNLWYAWE